MAECEELCHEAIWDARAVGARQAEVRALNALGMVMSYRGELDQGILHSREAVAIAEELDSPDDMATAYIDLAHVLGLAGRFGEAVEVCRVGYDAMARVGLARQDGSFLLANAAESLIKSGHWGEAADLLAKANASNAARLAGLSGPAPTRPDCGCGWETSPEPRSAWSRPACCSLSTTPRMRGAGSSTKSLQSC